MSIYDRIGEAGSFIKSSGAVLPEVGIVLGSGLGDFAEALEHKTIIPYEAIPHFKRAGTAGHAGRLVLGKVGDKAVAVLQGRYHYYEGYEMADVVFPVRVLWGLGAAKLILTNAAGGISPALSPGDLMIIRDHINMMGVNPLRGENDERLGVRFPDMSCVYDGKLCDIIAETMRGIGLPVRQGVYAAMSGPAYETPAEIRMLALLGADAVGMSTVPEAMAARHLGMAVAAISCITNMAAGITGAKPDHKEVIETANRVQERFIKLLAAVIPQF